MVARRVFVRLPDRNMALLLERYFPQFDETLVTAVELTGQKRAQAACSAEMLTRTCRLAAEPVGQVRLGRVFNPVPLRRSVLTAALLAVTVGIFGVRCPEAVAVWARRSLLMSDELWPRNTRLVVQGFPGGICKVARGADLAVTAKADLSKPVVPTVVKVRYRTVGGSRQQATMTREGTVDPTKDRFQEYSYTFRGVLAPIRFDVVGGDDAVRDLRIEVVDNPTILEMAVDCRYPEYMARSPRTLPVSGAMLIPAGSDVTLRATTNKDLVRVRIESALQDSTQAEALLDLADRPNRRSFAHALEDFRDDETLLLTLYDADGIKSREPLRVTLMAVADEAPELAVRLEGIGTAITPQASLPAVGQITDDYGLAQIWFEYKLDGGPSQRVVVQTIEGNPTDIRLQNALDGRGLGMSPGQRLLLNVQAADRCDLAGGANVGKSERWLLEVVTAEQLRTMLESRELVLRQRFEAILAEVVETRALLARIQFGDGSPASGNDAPPPGAAEPGEEPESDASGRRLLSLRRLRVERAKQNSQKHAHETRGVALAFENIRRELINNRIDTEELKIRLQEGIADPLRQIADQMCPETERRLETLLKHLAADAPARQSRDRAVAQLDAVMAAMRSVLARMIELEDFNEAISLLRQIIEAQEKINELTERKHKQKLRDLLEQ